MITFKPIIISNHKRKDGTIPVKIRITYKGVSRRLATNLVCLPNDYTRSLKIKNATILDKANELIVKMRECIADLSFYDLEGRDVDWIVARIRSRMVGDTWHLDFFDYGMKVAEGKSKQTARAYTAALNALERFLGKRELDINDITRTMLLDFVDFVDSEPKMHYNVKTGEVLPLATERKNKRASAMHIMKLHHIFSSAKDRYNDEDSDTIRIPRSPFDKIPHSLPHSQGQKSIGEEVMQRILVADTSVQSVRNALDAFVVSFALMGANLADLYDAKPFTGNEWVYNRQKTRNRRADKAEMRVVVPAHVQPYIKRLQANGDGAKWWLPVLHQMCAGGKDTATHLINRGLKRWCQDNGLQPFTFYAARHTWATLARKAGVEKATIDECLAHKGDFDVTDIYAERNWQLMSDANDKVLSMFRWNY